MNPEELAKKYRVINLRKIAQEVGGITKLAERLSRDKSQISQIIGKTPSQKIGAILSREFEETLKLPRYWLDQDHEKKVSSEYKKTQELIPFNLSAGYPIPHVSSLLANAAEPHNKENIKMIDELTKKEMEEKGISLESCVWMKINDDTMAPFFEKGTVVLIDTSKKEVEHGNRYAVRVGGQVIARNIFITSEGHYLVKCENETRKNKDREVKTLDKEVELVGRIVWRTGAAV